MRKFTNLIVFLFFSIIIYGQSSDQNYIKSIEVLEPVSINTFNNNYNTIKKIESITYFDGFGKAKQSVAVKQSVTKKDIVQHIEYDQFGRTSKQYLALPTSQNTGNYISNAQSQITTYYQNAFADQHPFSEVAFDNSPLNRTLESTAPGDTWQIINNSDTDHTTKYGYGVNTPNEVLRIEIDESNATEPLILSYYNAEELLKNIIKNENWTTSDGLLNTKEVFTDKNGRKIAEFSYENDGGTAKKLSTYYVYDNVGNLRFVLPPKLDLNPETVSTAGCSNYSKFFSHSIFNGGMSGGGGITVNINTSGSYKLIHVSLNAYLYSSNGSYQVNETPQDISAPCNIPDMHLGYLTIPGQNPSASLISLEIVNGHLKFNNPYNVPISGFLNTFTKTLTSTYQVYPGITVTTLNNLAFQYKYDQFNRQIEQKVPGKDWEYMVYDQLDRPILTQDANLRAANTWLFNKYDAFGRVVYSGKYTNSASRSALQTQADNFINASSNKANVVARIPITLSVGGVGINYSNNAFPTSSIETLTVSYFDDYNFTDSNLPTIPTHILGQEVTDRTKGLLTATWTKTLGSSTWSKNYTFYDKKGRVIYVYDKNHLGGYTQNKSKLDFRGKVEHSVTNHKRLATSSDLTIVDRFEYDHVERPKKHYQQINGQEEELIAQNNYNELGQLKSKVIGGDSSFNSISDNLYQDINPTLTITGNIIEKISWGIGWEGALTTVGQITNEGNISYEVMTTNKNMMIGLAEPNTETYWDSINFAIYNTATADPNGGSKLYVRESGVNKGYKTNYEIGDILSVERDENGSIHYKKNGIIFYTSASTSIGILLGDTCLGSTGAKIKNFKISSGYTDIVGLSITNITSNTQQIKKETGSSGWNAGLATVKQIEGDGYVSYKVSQTNKAIFVGLSDNNVNASYASIDYAFYNVANGTLKIYIPGSNFVIGSYQTNDEFKVERLGSSILFKKNGDLLYTYNGASNSSLLGDISMYHVGGAMYDFEIQNTESGLQTIDYVYNIRGWLTNINDVNNLGTDLFAYNLKYDEAIEGSASVSNVYNGNIKQVIWKSAHNNIKKSYAFEYDKLNRFSKSVYRELDCLCTGAYKFETSDLSYDANGNIRGLKRTNQNSQIIDDLTYSYGGENGNKLYNVTDSSNNIEGFKDDDSVPVSDYGYDANGNLKYDVNKGISNIEYNHLDLVKKVTFISGQKIEFTYDANGNKLQMKTTNPPGGITTVDYLGGFQYTNTQLQFFPTPEGYVANDGGTFKYVYQYKDHLGNNRVSFSDTNNNGAINPNNEILSNTDHYVMGLTHHGEFIAGLASNYNYKYQGKEQLAFAGYNMYNFGSRMYDPAVGRWFNTDPQNQFMSPYMAMGNNPVMLVDPDGEYALVIGAVIGAFIGAVTADMSGQDWKTGALKGAAIGLISAGVGQAVQGGAFVQNLGIGFWKGAAVGGASGFAGGVASESLNGGNFGEILTSGGTGMLIGGLIGGLQSGFDALGHNGNFWTGNGATYAIPDLNPNASSQVGEGMEYSTEYGKRYLDYFPDMEHPYKYYADGTAPKGYTFNKRRGVFLKKPGGRGILGVTEYVNARTGSNMYMASKTFSSKELLYLTTGHELLHVAHNSAGFTHRSKAHHSIYDWQARQAKAWGLNDLARSYRYRSGVLEQFFNINYDWRKYCIEVCPTKAFLN